MEDLGLSMESLHDREAFSRFLLHMGLPLIKEHTLGTLFLRCEDRTSLLRHLSAAGITKLAMRQQLTNAVSKLKRTMPLPSIVAMDPTHCLLLVHSIKTYGSYGGAIGLLIMPDGTCHHVNEALCPDQWGAYNLSPVASYCKVDGPVVSEVLRLGPLVGRPIYLPRCDEDPFVASPSTAFERETTTVDTAKLADFRRAFGDEVVVLTTACVRGTVSDPCVGLIPAFDRWADHDNAYIRSLHTRNLYTPKSYLQV